MEPVLPEKCQDEWCINGNTSALRTTYFLCPPCTKKAPDLTALNICPPIKIKPLTSNESKGLNKQQKQEKKLQKWRKDTLTRNGTYMTVQLICRKLKRLQQNKPKPV